MGQYTCREDQLSTVSVTHSLSLQQDRKEFDHLDRGVVCRGSETWGERWVAGATPFVASQTFEPPALGASHHQTVLNHNLLAHYRPTNLAITNCIDLSSIQHLASSVTEAAQLYSRALLPQVSQWRPGHSKLDSSTSQ